MAYQQQQGYPDQLQNILSGLDTWIENDGKIDFILHGGDMINITTAENIRKARDLFQLSVPVYVCLGNHDLTEPDAVDIWLKEAPEFFPGEQPNFSLQFGSIIIHVVPNQWENIPYYWKNKQEPHFLPGQITDIKKSLTAYQDALHILCTHSPVFGISVDQTGFKEPFHAPSSAVFTKSITDITEQYKQIRCIFSAHNHINMFGKRGNAHFVSVSSLVETPFEFKLIELDDKMITMSTFNLIPDVNFKAVYDYSKTYVQGRKRDREFTWILPQPE